MDLIIDGDTIEYLSHNETNQLEILGPVIKHKRRSRIEVWSDLSLEHKKLAKQLKLPHLEDDAWFWVTFTGEILGPFKTYQEASSSEQARLRSLLKERYDK